MNKVDLGLHYDMLVSPLVRYITEELMVFHILPSFRTNADMAAED